MEEILMNHEPCAARTAGVAHNPPLDKQASWHQCLTECQRVGLQKRVDDMPLPASILRTG